jgi:hypothetical protein
VAVDVVEEILWITEGPFWNANLQKTNKKKKQKKKKQKCVSSHLHSFPDFKDAEEEGSQRADGKRRGGERLGGGVHTI